LFLLALLLLLRAARLLRVLRPQFPRAVAALFNGGDQRGGVKAAPAG
jgi:hypothetical protein